MVIARFHIAALPSMLLVFTPCFGHDEPVGVCMSAQGSAGRLPYPNMDHTESSMYLPMAGWLLLLISLEKR